MAFFQVSHRSTRSKARIASIHTDHGVVQTPTFVPCATKGTLKGILPEQFKSMLVQLAFVNTYHLATHPGTEIIEKAKGVHEYGKLPIVLMSDSGGFQVFSLGRTDHRVAKLRGNESEKDEALLVKIDEDGVKLRSTHDGSLILFTPETSIAFQHQIGADLIMAFDECTYFPATHAYALKSLNRTHQWLERCITQHATLLNNKDRITKNQYLYGIIQGGQYEDLRIKSAEFVAQQDVDGVAIGGVSVGETKGDMRNQVRWCAPCLPENKPVHLLGVGHFDDIADLITCGIDTFDCVEPSRVARMGHIYQWQNVKSWLDNSRPQVAQSFFEMDITKGSYRDVMEPVDVACSCYVCTSFSKSYLHHLFKQRELLGYTLATYHNVYTMERYMGVLRDMIEKNEI
jgi:tRNA-guanine transglycosylase